MDKVMISLVAPVSRHKIERWVEEQVDRLDGEARASGIRLGRLAPGRLAQGGDWLVDVDRGDRDGRLEGDTALASVLTSFALLGLRPRLLVASLRERSDIPHAHAPTEPVPTQPGYG